MFAPVPLSPRLCQVADPIYSFLFDFFVVYEVIPIFWEIDCTPFFFPSLFNYFAYLFGSPNDISIKKQDKVIMLGFSSFLFPHPCKSNFFKFVVVL